MQSKIARMAVSIHAPLAGCDGRGGYHVGLQQSFNPRTPRGVRHYNSLLWRGDSSFNPRTPRGVRLPYKLVRRANVTVSIHAPLAGCDILPARSRANTSVSIHAPLAGCDVKFRALYEAGIVSIHAPLAGCDGDVSCGGRVPPCFNPRTPRGVRPLVGENINAFFWFQSTHPSRGATRLL